MGAFGDVAAIGQVTAAGVLLLVVWLLARVVVKGDFVPRKTVDLLLTARDAEIERCNTRGNEWHDAFEAQRYRCELLLDQNGELIEIARTVEHIVKGGGGDAVPPKP